jgi:hypothetical protein
MGGRSVIGRSVTFVGTFVGERHGKVKTCEAPKAHVVSPLD